MAVVQSALAAPFLDLTKSMAPLNKPEDHEVFCLFCDESFETKFDGYEHYAAHLDYKPIKCLICNGRFSNITDLSTHHQTQHPTHDEMNHEIHEDVIFERWVDEFLDGHGSEMEERISTALDKRLNCACSHLCPVCHKLQGGEAYGTSHELVCSDHSEVTVSNHIHDHLEYFPYECLLCSEKGNKFRVANLDATAASHLREHGLENPTVNVMKRHYQRTSEIGQLDLFINDFIASKRLIDKEYRNVPQGRVPESIGLIVNPNSSLHTLQADSSRASPPSDGNDSNGSGNSFDNSNGISHQNMKSNSKSTPSSYISPVIQQNLARLKEAAVTHRSPLVAPNDGHVRVFNGRVYGLPPRRNLQPHNQNVRPTVSAVRRQASSGSAHSTPRPSPVTTPRPSSSPVIAAQAPPPLTKLSSLPKNSEGTSQLSPIHNNTSGIKTEPVEKAEAGTMRMTSIVFRCCHCNAEVADKRGLKRHHYSRHPGIEIRCKAIKRSFNVTVPPTGVDSQMS